MKESYIRIAMNEILLVIEMEQNLSDPDAYFIFDYIEFGCSPLD